MMSHLFDGLTRQPGVLAAPQMFSTDLYVRLRSTVLRQIVFEHLLTFQDPAESDAWGRAAGSTEWVAGEVQGRALSVGWDWICQADGAISLLKSVAPRSNVMLLDSKGYDLPGDTGTDLLWQAIEAIPWRAEVAAAIHAFGRH